MVPAQPCDCKHIASPSLGLCVFISPSSLDSQESFPLLEPLPCSCLLRAAPHPLPHRGWLPLGRRERAHRRSRIPLERVMLIQGIKLAGTDSQRPEK